MLAIILTARILGVEMGIARALGAIVFSVIIGLLMHFIFYKDDANRETGGKLNFGQDDQREKPLWKTAVYFAVMVAILIFANWSKAENVGAWQFIYGIKWHITGALFLILAFILYGWFRKDELSAWTNSTWGFAKQILPLLMAGVLVAGFLLGRPGHEALIPAKWIVTLVGGNSLWANFFAAVSGALMYFAIPTQVFLDADCEEYFRHEGYFPKDEIISVLKEAGVN